MSTHPITTVKIRGLPLCENEVVDVLKGEEVEIYRKMKPPPPRPGEFKHGQAPDKAFDKSHFQPGLWWLVPRDIGEHDPSPHTLYEYISPHAPGDLLYVRETYIFVAGPLALLPGIAYRADKEVKWWYEDEPVGLEGEAVYNYEKPGIWKWRPSIHMPRWASRITVRVVSVRPEQQPDGQWSWCTVIQQQ